MSGENKGAARQQMNGWQQPAATASRLAANRRQAVVLHADDYGLSPHTSAQILECCRRGQLDGISVLPNFSCFASDMEKLLEALPDLPRELTLSVHLNLMEGPCVADRALVSDLVDEKGYLNRSWGSYFFASFLPGRKKLQKQLEAEIAAQIKKIVDGLHLEGPLYIDGHQHTQMIPVVFDALCAVIQREGWQVRYIRDSAEPLAPFLKQPGLWKSFRPVNLVKNLILHVCAVYAEPKMKKIGCAPMYLWGLMMSGHMDKTRIEKILPDMERAAAKRGRQLEILFHPGKLLESEIKEEYSSAEALEFYLSAGRDVERAALEGAIPGKEEESHG